MKLRIATLILLLLIFAMNEALGKSVIPTSFYNITTAEGLPSNTVGAIKKDSTGFIWIGTKTGLCRYDGCEIKTYPFLAEDDIWTIEELDNEILLIGTRTCVKSFNRRTSQVEILNIPSAIVKSIKKIDRNSFLVGTDSGLYIVEDGRPQRIFFETGLSPSNHVTSIIRENDSIFWLSTANGLGRMNLKTRQTSIYRMEEGITNSNNFICLAKGINHIYLGSFNKGVFCFNLQKRTFTPVKGFEHNLVMTMDYHDGLLCVGTNGKGMKVLSLADGHMENFSYKEKKRYSIGCNTITSFLYDKGIWWIGTQFGGLNYTPLVGEKFSYYDWKDFYSTDYNIRSFCQLKSGNKLIGTRTGLFYISEKENRIKKFISEDESSSLRSDIILCIKELSNNSILISTYGGGVYLFDENSLTLKDFSKEEPLLYGCFFQFAEDQEGNLWFASTDGVYRCSMQGKLLKKYDISNSGLTNNSVYYVYPDSIGRLWIGTNIGLFLMDIETGKIRFDCFDSSIKSEIIYIMSDSKKNFWICSDNGLYKINQDLTINKHYTKKDILPDNAVMNILEDKKGNYWITTMKEIVRFDSEENIHYTYRRMDGLIGTDFNNSICRSDSGIIWWANEGGLIYTSENDRDVNTKIIKHPIVSSFLIDGVEYDPTYHNQSEAIVVYKDNTLCFKLSNLDYSLPYANYYEYKLDGYDKDWVKQTGVNEVIYRNLPSGKYIFKIRASESSEPAQQWVVSVHKSYFTLAMILLVVVIIAVLLVYFYGKIRSLQKRMKEERLILGTVVQRQNGAKEMQSSLPEEKLGDIMDELLAYMDRDKPYLNAKLSINEVASQLGCTEMELSQLLNSHMKVNFANFINVYRVKEIKLRLNQENLSKYTLKALSEQCGFNSKTTFYRVFKNVSGMTPMEYCKKLNLVIDENRE